MKRTDTTFLLCLSVLASLMFMPGMSSNAFGQGAEFEIEGFTEPFRRIELSSDESGAIAALAVRVGDRVEAGDIVAKLDCRVQEIQLEIATHLAQAKSQRIAAAEALKKRQAIAQRLKEMRDKGHASESEIIRADMELSIARSKYATTLEEAAVRSIEERRAAAQLERRNIRASISGMVARIHNREGEFLSPLHPEVCTIVQVDKLLATFNIRSADLSRVAINDNFELRLPSGQTVAATVYQIGVETDPQSGTVEVKLVIDNTDYRIRSGESILLSI